MISACPCSAKHPHTVHDTRKISQLRTLQTGLWCTPCCSDYNLIGAGDGKTPCRGVLTALPRLLRLDEQRHRLEQICRRRRNQQRRLLRQSYQQPLPATEAEVLAVQVVSPGAAHPFGPYGVCRGPRPYTVRAGSDEARPRSTVVQL